MAPSSRKPGFVSADALRQEMAAYLLPRRDRSATVHAIVMMLRGKGWPVPYRAVRNAAAEAPDSFMMLGGCIVLTQIPAGSAKASGAGAGHSTAPTFRAPPAPPAQAKGEGSVAEERGGGRKHCLLCKVLCANDDEWRRHCLTVKHRIKQMAKHVEDSGKGVADAGGMLASQMGPGVVCDVGQSVRLPLTLTNSNSYQVVMLSCNLLRNSAGVQVCDASGAAVLRAGSMVFGPDHSTTLSVQAQPQVYGVISDAVVMEFGSGHSILRPFSISCRAELPAGVDIAPSAPYEPKQRKKLQLPATDIIPGEAPAMVRFKWKNPPGQHHPPIWMSTMATQDGGMAYIAKRVDAPVNSMQDYCDKLKNVLWIEELQHEVDVRQYDIDGAELAPDTSCTYLYLKVPGLAESRPSVLRGDQLYVSRADGSFPGKEWEGFVHHVELDRVALRFDSSFHTSFIRGMRFNVRFTISRSTFNFMQSAISRAATKLHPLTVLGRQLGTRLAPPSTTTSSGFLSFMFGAPSPGPAAAAKITQEPTWTRPLNNEQKEAVRAVLKGDHAPLPYLIFGPPGTGKTMTVTEAVVQVWKMDPSARLLLVAPSNSAADLLAEKALERGVPESQIMRVCAFSRPKDDLPIGLMRISNETDDGFVLGDREVAEAKKKRLVAVTCLMAAKLYAHGFQTGHFTHVFIDEAGHAEEPLTLAATAGLLTATESARLVMAGDPQQLGPIILSPLASRLGLSTSAMERLIQTEPYTRRDWAPHYDTTFVAKLLVNYRSHPAILRLPNALFYKSELVAGADHMSTHGLLGWKGLDEGRMRRPTPSFPIVFHSIVGKDEREGNSPSWFNVDEVALVNKYVKSLLDMRSNRPDPKDIGVITPYHKQVQKIRKVLAQYSQIKVGSVEEFQGQERRAIIVSTVRSNTEFLEFDSKHRLGFLKNPKRFNVAITRPKGMLIIIGNPMVLMHDPNWAALLQYVHLNGGWVGAPPPPEVVSASAPRGPPGSAAEQRWFDTLTQSAPVAGYGASIVSRSPAPLPTLAYGMGVPGGAPLPTGTGAEVEGSEAERQLLEQLGRLSLGAGGVSGVGGGVAATGVAVVVEELGGDTLSTGWLQVEGGMMPRLD